MPREKIEKVIVYIPEEAMDEVRLAVAEDVYASETEVFREAISMWRSRWEEEKAYTEEDEAADRAYGESRTEEEVWAALERLEKGVDEYNRRRGIRKEAS